MNVPPCEQIQQLSRAVFLVDVPFLCLVLLASGVFLHLPTEWNLAGHFAVGEFRVTPEQAVILFPLPWRLQFDVGGFQLVGSPSPVFDSPFLVAAEGQFGRCHYARPSGDSSLPA